MQGALHSLDDDQQPAKAGNTSSEKTSSQTKGHTTKAGIRQPVTIQSASGHQFEDERLSETLTLDSRERLQLHLLACHSNCISIASVAAELTAAACVLCFLKQTIGCGHNNTAMRPTRVGREHFKDTF